MKNKYKTSYYGAFGSNLNKRQMKNRCPESIPCEAATLKGYMLCFRSVADVIPKIDEQVPIAVYKITHNCEDALDHYESFPSLYRKEYTDIQLNGQNINLMFYVMNQMYGFGKPSGAYYRTIAEGYIDWGLSEHTLVKAHAYSIKNDSGNSYRSKNWDSAK